VSCGLGAVGIGSVAGMAFAARGLTGDGFAAFATWWTVANLVGLAFLVVEMYLPRLLVAASSSGQDDRPVVASFSRGVLLAASSLGLAVVVSSPWSLSRLFDGEPALLGLVVVYLFAMSLQSLQRGVAIGRDRFEVFPVQMGSDGAVRLVGSIGVALFGSRSPATYAGVMCLAAAVGAVAGTPVNRRWFAWDRPLANVALAPIGLLFSASIGPLVVNNAGVPWLTATTDVAPRTIGAVAGALTLSRLPTLMVGSAYGPVLAPLARAVEDGRRTDFERFHRKAAVAALVLAGLFAAAFALGGPRLLQLYLGPSFRLSRVDMAAMGAGSGLMFVSVVEQAALVALSAWQRVAAGWLAGLAAFACIFLLPIDPVLRVSFAVFVAPLTAVVVMAVSRMLVEGPVFARHCGA
jgi:O-antigen/teichoic acid export membrane protein